MPSTQIFSLIFLGMSLSRACLRNRSISGSGNGITKKLLLPRYDVPAHNRAAVNVGPRSRRAPRTELAALPNYCRHHHLRLRDNAFRFESSSVCPKSILANYRVLILTRNGAQKRRFVAPAPPAE